MNKELKELIEGFKESYKEDDYKDEKLRQEFIDKFPHLEGKTIKIHFDLWQTHPFAIKKRAGLVKKKGWKKREYEEIAKEKGETKTVSPLFLYI